MSAWEVSFKIRYKCPFIKMSESYPGSRISVWCVWGAEMLQMPIEYESVITQVENYVEELGLTILRCKESRHGCILSLKCSCSLYRNVWHFMDKNHCIPMHPASFLDGWGYYRMVSLEEKDIKKFFRDMKQLGPAELLSKRTVNGEAIPSSVRVEDLFSGMTKKQVEAVMKAYDSGYFSSPREVTIDTIAMSFGVSRSTCEEHLRKAENKIMEAVLPYLKAIQPYLKIFRKSGERGEESLLLREKKQVVEIES